MKNSKEWTTCCITDRVDVVDDASISIEFGFGSTRDMQTFRFPLINHDVAESILQFIQSLMVEGRSVTDSDFLTDYLDEGFEENQTKK